MAGGGELDRREHARRELRIPLLNGAAGEHAGALAIDHGQPLDAGVPGLLGCEVDDELHPAVGKLRVRVFALDTHVQLALERAVGVGRAQLAGLLMPRALQVAAAHQALAPDVEDVGEVRLDGDLEDQADRMGRIADQVIVLVDALEDRAVEAEANRPFFEDDVVLRAILGARQRKLGRGELVANRKVVDGAGVEQQRNAPVDGDGVARHEARIPGKEADRASRHQRGVGVGDHELMVVVDGDPRHAMSDRHCK